MKQQSKTIFEKLDTENFRKRTAIYIREKSISKLFIFMAGYHLCEESNNIKSKDTVPPFWLFFHWICKYYNHDGSYYNWDGIILMNSNNDEEKALDTFFEKFDEFRKFKPSKIIVSQINNKAIKYFSSDKAGITRWNYKAEKKTRIGPAKKLFIVEYNQNFGSTIHHQSNKKGLHTDYFKTTQEAIKNAELEYGEHLAWEEISKDEIEMVYEMIN